MVSTALAYAFIFAFALRGIRTRAPAQTPAFLP